jgi:hypothetical protein
MLNAREVLSRVKRLKAFDQMEETDYTPLYYKQEFTPAAGGAISAPQGQDFPNGGIIIGISASAFVPNAAPAAGRMRHLFQIDFTYTNNQALLVNGPVCADALMGGGDSDLFPVREIIVAPTQKLMCRTANNTNGPLTVHVVYHCLVYRLQS